VPVLSFSCDGKVYILVVCNKYIQKYIQEVKMKIEEVKKRNERKTVRINLKITPAISKWMRRHQISPTALFNEAVRELMENETAN
jgi:hypothetical protein